MILSATNCILKLKLYNFCSVQIFLLLLMQFDFVSFFFIVVCCVRTTHLFIYMIRISKCLGQHESHCEMKCRMRHSLMMMDEKKKFTDGALNEMVWRRWRIDTEWACNSF